MDGPREEDDLIKLSASEIEQSDHWSCVSDYRDSATLDGDDQRLEAGLDTKAVDQDEKDLILKKLKELALNHVCQDFSSTAYGNKPAVESDMHSEDLGFVGEETSSQKHGQNHCLSSDCQFIIDELIRENDELRTFTTEQTMKMSHLEQKLAEAESEIQRLKYHCSTLESTSSLTMDHLNEKGVQSLEKLPVDATESIYLVGGYDGESWLSTMDLYFPSHDVRKSLRPMNSVRSYASAAVLNGELYIFGGGDGNLWYNTVESYSPTTNQWILRPSLNGSKGSLAGAAIDSKIFAIGGGNGVESLSDVEMLDLDIGKWIRTRSMLQKRFALAAVELSGVLYATGGYDGNDYMNSAERFDPREHCWTRIASMNTRRGCHSLAVLNGKIYALGGFDGNRMVPSIEIYDPCLGSWMSGEPMKQSRGYMAAAVVKESLYVIGGLESDDADILDTVECFKEGQGWEEINSSAIGKRCFMSAVTL